MDRSALWAGMDDKKHLDWKAPRAEKRDKSQAQEQQ
jgi:hypothetical protein